jgi:tryptophan synthase alpha chain
VTRIEKRFKTLLKEGKKAFIPYIMAGDPSLEMTSALIEILENAEADIIELGVPFSDPVADGPVIQEAGERARKAGVTLRKVLAFVKEMRAKTQIPIILMTYYNPVFKYGEEEFMRDAAEAGVDGLIVPDMPLEEGDTLLPLGKKHGVNVILLAAPTSGEERLKNVARASQGFIYYVSITGITGARLEMAASIEESIQRLKHYKKPVAIGFGVSTPEEAARVAHIADGVIIGSAIVKKAKEADGEELKAYLKSLRESIK